MQTHCRLFCGLLHLLLPARFAMELVVDVESRLRAENLCDEVGLVCLCREGDLGLIEYFLEFWDIESFPGQIVSNICEFAVGAYSLDSDMVVVSG